MQRAGFVVTAVLAACSYPRPERLGDAASGSDDGGGSGSAAIAKCENKSGGRIKQRGFLHADGLAMDAPHDATYDWDCIFVKAGDGKVRCLPSGYDNKILYGDLAFSDAGCNTAILGIAPQDFRPGVPFADYDRLYEASGKSIPCIAGAGRRVFNVGNKLATPAKVYHHDDLGACVQNAPQGSDYYSAQEIGPAEFAEGVPVHLGTGRIWIAAYDTPDGGRFCRDQLTLGTMHDSHFDDARCYDGMAYDERRRCLLDTDVIQSYFGDSSCMSPLSISNGLKCNPNTAIGYVGESTTTACGAPTRRPKRKKSQVSAFYRQGTQCKAFERYYDTWDTESAYIPESELAEITYDVTSGPGQRLKPRYAALDGALFDTTFWYDTMLQAACYFIPVGNKIACAPRAEASINPSQMLFTSAFCSPASVASYGFVYKVDACAATPPAFIAKYDPSTFVNVAYYRAGAEVTTPVYWLGTDGTCQPIPPTARAYQLGADITSMLVMGTEVIQ